MATRAKNTPKNKNKQTKGYRRLPHVCPSPCHVTVLQWRVRSGYEPTFFCDVDLVTIRAQWTPWLLCGLPQVQIDKIQRVQNAAARLIFEQPKFCNIPVYLSFTGFPSSIVLSLRFYLWLLKLFTALRQIILISNWSAEGNQLQINPHEI